MMGWFGLFPNAVFGVKVKSFFFSFLFSFKLSLDLVSDAHLAAPCHIIPLQKLTLSLYITLSLLFLFLSHL